MRLVSFTASNYKRFVETTSLKLHADLIAVVGPNEAGKSSFLRGLARLNDDEPFERSEHHRRSSATPELRWKFELQDSDHKALKDAGLMFPITQITVVKGGEGKRIMEMDLQPFNGIIQGINTGINKIFQQVESASPRFTLPVSLIATLGNVQRVILSSELPWSDEDKAMLIQVAEYIDKLGTAEVETWFLLPSLRRVKALHRELRRVASRLEQLGVIVAESHPQVEVERALMPRLPDVLLFGEADRNLLSSYDLEEVAHDTPPALEHLNYLSGLELEALLDEVKSGTRADVATRRDEANYHLRHIFSQSWNQQHIALQIDVDNSNLYIQTINLDDPDQGYSDLGERSDGMRWFSSLLAYVHGWTERPIVLVDEIESHLHYDAQADLINVLSAQEFTSKIIYSTHSLGCLPPDLGNGLRVIEPVDSTTSRFQNQVWRNAVGFSPLMTSLGGAAMSFTPSRHVLVVEGPSDAILLPTVFRQAQALQKLPFQIVPGLSEVAEARAKGLLTEAGRVAFLVDGDSGGKANKTKLVNGGIDIKLIKLLFDPVSGAALEVEDLIEASIYVKAVSAELSLWQTVEEGYSTEDLPACLRTKALAAWCKQRGLKPPDKIAVAERIVDMALSERIVSEVRKEVITTLLKVVATILGVELLVEKS